MIIAEIVAKDTISELNFDKIVNHFQLLDKSVYML